MYQRAAPRAGARRGSVARPGRECNFALCCSRSAQPPISTACSAAGRTLGSGPCPAGQLQVSNLTEGGCIRRGCQRRRCKPCAVGGRSAAACRLLRLLAVASKRPATWGSSRSAHGVGGLVQVEHGGLHGQHSTARTACSACPPTKTNAASLPPRCTGERRTGRRRRQAGRTLVLHMKASELVTPWLPMPESRKPWKGKWSGPRAGAALTCGAGAGAGGTGGQRVGCRVWVKGAAARTPQQGLSATPCGENGARWQRRHLKPPLRAAVR
jgi:hypothetical protein